MEPTFRRRTCLSDILSHVAEVSLHYLEIDNFFGFPRSARNPVQLLYCAYGLNGGSTARGSEATGGAGAPRRGILRTTLAGVANRS